MTADSRAKAQIRASDDPHPHPACSPQAAITTVFSGSYRRSESHVGRRPKTQFRPNSDPIPPQSGRPDPLVPAMPREALP